VPTAAPQSMPAHARSQHDVSPRPQATDASKATSRTKALIVGPKREKRRAASSPQASMSRTLVPLSGPACRSRRSPAPIPMTALEQYPALHARTTAALVLAEVARAPIECIGVRSVITNPIVLPGVGSDWVVLRADDELRFRGSMPVPKEARKKMQILDRAGLEVQDIVIAHELPTGRVEAVLGQPAAKLAGLNGFAAIHPSALPPLLGPIPVPKRTLRYSRGLGSAVQGVAKGAAVATAVAGVVVGGAVLATAAVGAASGAALASSAAALDPIVFGAITDPGSPGVAAFCLITKWDW